MATTTPASGCQDAAAEKHNRGQEPANNRPIGRADTSNFSGSNGRKTRLLKSRFSTSIF
jgi:hypothetical protein